MAIIKYTLPNEKDYIDLKKDMKIFYDERPGYKFKDCWVSFPDVSEGKVWFLWEKISSE